MSELEISRMDDMTGIIFEKTRNGGPRVLEPMFRKKRVPLIGLGESVWPEIEIMRETVTVQV